VLGGILCVAILAGGLCFGWTWWRLQRFLEATDDAYVEADISTIAPRVAGLVREIRVADNQPVLRGAELVVIDDRDLQARLAEVRARRSARHAAMNSLDRESSLQSAAVARASADVESASAERERAELDRSRYEELATSQLVSRQRVELARLDARKMQSALTAARATLVLEQRRADLLIARKEEIGASIRESEAAVAQAEHDDDSTIVRAPIDGVVGNRKVRVGQYVHVGTAMMALTPLGATYVIANFKETQVRRMRPGQRAAIEVDAYPGTRVTGMVESLAPAAGSRFALLPPENATGNFTRIVQRIPVRIRLLPDHPLAGRIRPGMSATATVDTR
jgi:membrane fusion protein (multidrug efflux system)